MSALGKYSVRYDDTGAEANYIKAKKIANYYHYDTLRADSFSQDGSVTAAAMAASAGGAGAGAGSGGSGGSGGATTAAFVALIEQLLLDGADVNAAVESVRCHAGPFVDCPALRVSGGCFLFLHCHSSGSSCGWCPRGGAGDGAAPHSFDVLDATLKTLCGSMLPVMAMMLWLCVDTPPCIIIF